MGAASRHATRDINAVNALQTEEATRIVSQLGADKSGDMLRYVHPSLLVRRRWCVPDGVQVQLGWWSRVYVILALSAWSFGARCEQRALHLAERVQRVLVAAKSEVRNFCDKGVQCGKARSRARRRRLSEGVWRGSLFHGSGVLVKAFVYK